jgi:16S rRNA (cytidine1402-2'-O)-methyltransferase
MTATVSSYPLVVSIERPALYVVATPIGNLADISYRAVAVLREMDLILAEDTRVTQRLLQQYAIHSKLIALHEHNEQQATGRILSKVTSGKMAIALLSDAGTPLIADPGYRLVRSAHEQAIPVLTVPGACAAIAALSIAGVPSDRFVFEGFLPPRSAARKRHLSTFSREARTVIFYEAPHRILATMEDLCATLGDEREVVVARELTKLHETLYRGCLGRVTQDMKNDPNAARGELVIVLGGAPEPDMSEDEDQALSMVKTLSRHVAMADAVKLTAELTGIKRNRLYRLAHSPNDDQADG